MFKNPKMPKSVSCYVCGRAYGTRSIGIHLKTCRKKWDIEQQRKPKNRRRKCPDPPQGYDEFMKKKKITEKQMIQMNEMAFDNFNQNLEKCKHCERTFNYDAFVRHRKICTASKPFKPLNKTLGKRKSNVSKPNNFSKTTEVYEEKPKSNNNFGGSNTRNLDKSPNLKKKDYYKKEVPKKNGYKNKSKSITKARPKKNMNSYMNKKPKKAELIEIPLGNNQESFNVPEHKVILLGMEQCRKCKRSFNADRIDRHEAVCQANKKVKVKYFHKPITKKEKRKIDKKKKNNWKAKHEEFIKNMKYMRKLKKAEEKGIDIKHIAPPPVSKNPDYKECPYCERTFSSKAHERHIKSCVNVRNRPAPLRRKPKYNYKKSNVTKNLKKKILDDIDNEKVKGKYSGISGSGLKKKVGVNPRISKGSGYGVKKKSTTTTRTTTTKTRKRNW